ncbi:MAG: DUF3368 domain-containing protein [Thermoplasmata archaeon]
MIVVCDSGPLIHLSRIEMLHLLREFFEEIYLPKEVYDELTSGGQELPGSSEIKTSNWIKVKTVENNTAKEILMEYLDEGESEAILLAKEMDADLLLIDDLAGRRTARTHGIDVIGTLGILDRAAKEGKVEDLMAIIVTLREKGFWIDDELVRKLNMDG